MFEGLGEGDVGDLIGREGAEGAAGCGEDESGDFGLAAAVAVEALENGVVLAIDGEEFDAALGGGGGDDFASHDEDFLGGDGEVFAGFNGGERGVESGGADDGDEDDVGTGEGGEFEQAFRAEVDFYIAGEQGAEGGFLGGVINGDVADAGFAGLGS